jgi:hypothetical protein
MGGIIEFDDEDREYHISCMEGSKKSFRITEGGILCSLDNPVTHRKMCNIFIFSTKDLEKVQDMFDEI